MDVSILWNSNDGAEADDLAILHDHPGRRREFSAYVSREAVQHLQYFRRRNGAVLDKAQMTWRDALQQRFKIMRR
ncbi:hypothetical protein RLV_7307 [Rhizobium leguminosarum bv. viciae]|nr:hypothetical protein RLV_7307 [Rhizobium leguminosarum bv. viciae]